MNEDKEQALRIAAAALQDTALPESETAALLPAVIRNAAAVGRLAPRIAFEDEPALYAGVMERARG